MGQRTIQFATENNRRSACAGHERRCAHCQEWIHISEFRMSHGYVGYTCKSCDRAMQLQREKVMPSRVRRKLLKPTELRGPQFDDRFVDVRAWLKFATAPTPQQLIERSEAA